MLLMISHSNIVYKEKDEQVIVGIETRSVWYRFQSKLLKWLTEVLLLKRCPEGLGTTGQVTCDVAG